MKPWGAAGVYSLILLAVLLVPVGRVHARAYMLEMAHRSPGHFMADALVNVALFLPLGWWLARGARETGLATGRSLLLAAVASALFSVSVETLQFFVTLRYSSILDVAWNVAGGGLGALAGIRALARNPRPS